MITVPNASWYTGQDAELFASPHGHLRYLSLPQLLYAVDDVRSNSVLMPWKVMCRRGMLRPSVQHDAVGTVTST